MDKGKIHLYQYLKADILKKVKSGIYSPGTQLPGELELSEQYEISRNTVRQALLELVDEGWLERTRGKGTYIRVQSDGFSYDEPLKKGFVGVILPWPNAYLAPRIVKGIREILDENGYSIRVYDSADTEYDNEQAINQALDEGAVGLLIQPPKEAVFSPRLKKLRADGYPVVLFDRPYTQMIMDCVMTDNASAAFDATKHLIDLGHTEIAFIAESSFKTASVQSRYDGYVQALIQNGLPNNPDLTIAPYHDTTIGEQSYMEYWNRIVKDLLGSAKRPSAVFAANDIVAMSVIRLSYSIGLSVPKDLAVVGFDNSEMSEVFVVPITTVDQPLAEVGRRTALQLLYRLDKGNDSVNWIYLPAKLIIRESCGAKLCANEVSRH